MCKFLVGIILRLSYEAITNQDLMIKTNIGRNYTVYQKTVLVLLAVTAICSIIAMILSVMSYVEKPTGEKPHQSATLMQYSSSNKGLIANAQLVRHMKNGKRSRKLQNEEAKPNIFIVMVDDLGYADLASDGHPTQEWGPIDELSKMGMKFTQFYSEALCTPSRAQLLTGRIPIRYGMSGGANRVFVPQDPGGLPKEEITIPELLKSAGYISGMNGKWHLGTIFGTPGINCERNDDGCHLPFNHGFDFVGTYIPLTNNLACDENQKYYPTPSPLKCFLYRGKSTTPWQAPIYHENLTESLVNEAKDFLTKNRKNKWFYYFATPQVHKVLYSSKNFEGSSRRGPMGDTMNELGWSVGEILKHLKNLDLDRNTLFLFISDNGASREDCEEGGNNKPLEAGKGMSWEGGIRVPMLAYWPNKIKPGVSQAVVTLSDILPTVAHLAGIQVPQDRELDGKDISSILFGDGSQSIEDYNRPIFWYCNEKLMAMRQGEYKLHYWTWLWTFKEASAKCINGLTPYSTQPLTNNHYYWFNCNETKMMKQDPPLVYNIEIDPGEEYPLRNYY